MCIYTFIYGSMAVEIPENMGSECLVLKSRRAARAVTRRYDKLLRPYGLQCTQVSLLFNVASGHHRSVTELASQMAIERSTLTRNLKLLQRRGYIETDSSGQGRPQQYILTERGEALVREMIPHWREAQAQLRNELGDEGWDAIQAALSTIGAVG
ncbi:MarR family winged helix-turn-helix transcriptional regulator [Nitratireductor sp. XY-223]|uniref:MarR family winged helix-turn-helix transcriptional regulator n=1 Tax=Nitratireductor sp. XY-223 TaxID=2561926 RepID=UPI0010A9D070|nr:MarR family winged helix-turn-helix transcriptional regulator [Nitratireductor sp. XY-223]